MNRTPRIASFLFVVVAVLAHNHQRGPRADELDAGDDWCDTCQRRDLMRCELHSCTEPIRLETRQNDDASHGIAVIGAGLASAHQPQPLQLEIWDEGNGRVRLVSGGYDHVTEEPRGLLGTGRLALEGGVAFAFHDRWDFQGDTLHLDRTVAVTGNGAGGFLSAATLQLFEPQWWPQVEWFAPGTLYGGFDHLAELAMVALPDRLYDLRGPGWQQEHYSLAPRRGVGLHRLWLPWVATSQLNGIFGLMDLDEDLFERLCRIDR